MMIFVILILLALGGIVRPYRRMYYDPFYPAYYRRPMPMYHGPVGGPRPMHHMGGPGHGPGGHGPGGHGGHR